RLANQGERNRRIIPKLLFEMFRRCNPSEAAAENNYLGCFCWRGRRAGRRFWTKKVFAEPTSRLRQDSKKEAEQQPTNKRGKENPHFRSCPLWLCACEQREQDDIDCSPKGK